MLIDNRVSATGVAFKEPCWEKDLSRGEEVILEGELERDITS